MTDAAYAAESVAAPPAVRAEMQRLAALHAGGTPPALWAGLSGLGGVVLVVYGSIALIDLVFGVIDRGHWTVLLLGTTILLVPMLLIRQRTARLAQGEHDTLSATLRAEADAGQVLRHTLRRDARHWFVEHEHGVVHVCPADAARTLYLDFSAITDDARHDHWYATGLVDRTRWTWFTTPGTGILLGFEADGDALPRNTLMERGDNRQEAAAALFDALGEPEDGTVVRRPFAKVDAFLRKRGAP